MDIHDAYDPDKKEGNDVEILYDGHIMRCSERFPPEIKTVINILERAGKIEKTLIGGVYKIGNVHIAIE